MVDIRHRVGITASPQQVYEALTTKEGLSGWWTRDVRGEEHEGGKLEFYFGGPEAAAEMEVVELVPDHRVVWRCVQGPGEWLDTALTFELKSSGGEADETVVLFTHADWREPVEFMHHCSTRWAQFLIGLKAGLEEGQATPFPEDKPISSSWR